MPKPSTLNPDHFLSRLPLDEMTNAGSIDPYDVLDGIFIFGDVDELADMFRNFCAAALSEKFAWKEGSPGNLLFFSEKLEQLIEACFLIQQSPKKKKHLAMKMKSKHFKKIRMPMRLSKKEWSRPLIVIDDFFTYSSLPQWKLALYTWLEASLSDYSVAESIDPSALLPFYQQIEKLIEAAYWIASRSGRKQK